MPSSPRTLSRRAVLQQVALLTAAASLSPRPAAGAAAATTKIAPAAEPRIMTVTGPIPAADLGLTLSHEHVTTDFLGAEKLPAPRYDRAVARALIQPHLERLRERGVRSLFECTPAHIGRDVLLLRDLSQATKVQVITNTGYYGAAGDRFLPRHAFTESDASLAERWLHEWQDGIEGTGIRPGFIKLGTGNGKLPEHHRKLLRAACRVHRATGLTIAMHTGDGEAARDELRLLTEQGVAPAALVWVHAQNDPGPIQIELARLGVWISLDGYSLALRNPERFVNLVLALKKEGLLHRVLLSHDDGWAVEGETASGATLQLFGNGNPQPYRSLFERGHPDLLAAGLTEEDWRQIMIANPAAAFTIRPRLL